MALECFEPFVSHSAVLAAPDPGTSRLSSSRRLLPLLWQGLLRGAFRICTTESDSMAVSLTIRVQPIVEPLRSRDERAIAIFEGAIRGQAQKHFAHDLDLAESTVAASLRCSLERMGLKSRFTRLPLAVPLLAHAVCRANLLQERIQGDLPARAGETCLIRLVRPEAALKNALSPGEYDVARQLIEGKSYEEMAQSREVSLRTIANQLSSVGRKLGSRGRFELIRRAVESFGAPDAIYGTPPQSGPPSRAALPL